MTTISISFDVPFSEAIKAAVTRGVVLPDVYYGELQGLARQLSFSIAGIGAYDQLQAVRDSLAKAMASGQSFRAWKETAAAQALELPEHRLDNIWRTNLQGNYMRGRWEQLARNAKTRPYLMYDAINDSRTRPAHLAMDGTIRRWDDSFWLTHTPPCGYRCRCDVIGMTEEQAMRRSAPGADGKPRGIYKDPRLDDGMPAEPDAGWDYHPYFDRWQPMRKALANRAEAPGASAILGEALAGAIEGSLRELYAAWVADHGADEAKAMWEKYFSGQALPS